jgi:CheY-like chemotaxis protein
MRKASLSGPRIVAVVNDLFFVAKIRETAERAGAAVEFATSEQALWARSDDKPALVIVDLNLTAIQPLSLIAKIKNDPAWKQTSVLGFVSHVQSDLIQKAQEAGCDRVVARSAFARELPQILGKQVGE